MTDPDALYETLIAAHEGLDESDSQKLNARLILLLMNEIRDHQRVCDLIAAAKAQQP